MTWREISADQNLRMAGMMLDLRGQLNDAQAELTRLRVLVAEVRRVMALHDGCDTNCDLELDLREVLGDGDL